MMAANNIPWKTEFDPILNQVYYINSEDGSVSFDLPCEVQNTRKRHSGSGLFARISSKLSLIRSKSSCPFIGKEVPCSRCASTEQGVTKEKGIESPISDNSVLTQPELEADTYSLTSPETEATPRNAYMMEKSFNLYDYDDMSSIMSEESIQSFYHELPRSEIYYDYEASVYVDKLSLPNFDFDEEQERYELRQQMLQELY